MLTVSQREALGSRGFYLVRHLTSDPRIAWIELGFKQLRVVTADDNVQWYGNTGNPLYKVICEQLLAASMLPTPDFGNVVMYRVDRPDQQVHDWIPHVTFSQLYRVGFDH